MRTVQCLDYLQASKRVELGLANSCRRLSVENILIYKDALGEVTSNVILTRADLTARDWVVCSTDWRPPHGMGHK